MKTASISEAKNRLSALLRRVKAGETVIICDRDEPVAQIAPIRAAGRNAMPKAWEARLNTLVRQGLARRPAGRGTLPDEWLVRRRPKMRDGAAALQALLEERESNR